MYKSKYSGQMIINVCCFKFPIKRENILFICLQNIYFTRTAQKLARAPFNFQGTINKKKVKVKLYGAIFDAVALIFSRFRDKSWWRHLQLASTY